MKDDKTYEGVRKSGASKEKAARLANAKAAGGKPSQKGGKASKYRDRTKDELMKKARDVGIEGHDVHPGFATGRSKMDRGQLADALRNH
ncbi:DUF7218 family protein [Capillimicrobium parvum]|uniref:DUF7218 family protein n=1 Tax=Capillimicrobium parvum TaxID=2884022 RepID=UPI00216ABE5E|nr:Rho termination factor [Capillimicrobium parvum]